MTKSMMMETLLVVLGASVSTMVAGSPSICDLDSSVVGYSSIEELNHDIKIEFEALQQQEGNKQHDGAYIFNLCPHTVFRDEGAILPLLNNSHFICGNEGDSLDKCTITGGKTQVRIVDYPEANMEFLSFRGITFSNSIEHGVAAEAGSGVLAEFVDCHWVDGHGTSGIHIEYQEYAEAVEEFDIINPVKLYNPQEFTETQDEEGNIFQHRQLTSEQEVPVAGMSVHLYNSSISNVVEDGFRAIHNTGNLRLVNVTMKNSQTGVLINIFSGNATIEDCHFESVDAVSIIRVVNSPSVTIRRTNFLENYAVGMVTAINSNVGIYECEFRGSHAPRGGEVLAFSSVVVLQDSCIYKSTAMTAVYESSNSRLLAENVFGYQMIGDYCPGILVEDEVDSGCFSGASCNGRCDAFTATECAIINKEDENFKTMDEDFKTMDEETSSSASPLRSSIMLLVCSAVSAMYL